MTSISVEILSSGAGRAEDEEDEFGFENRLNIKRNETTTHHRRRRPSSSSSSSSSDLYG